jgi:hypothetical protein
MATVTRTLIDAWNKLSYEGTDFGIGHAPGEDLEAMLEETSTNLLNINTQLETHATRHESGGADPLDVADLDDAGSRLLAAIHAAGVTAGAPLAADPVAKMSDLAALAAGIDWKDAVIDSTILDDTAVVPAVGDRWLINGVGINGWAGMDYQIAQCATIGPVTWTYEDATAAAAAGWAVWDKAAADGYVNVTPGAAWIKAFGLEVQSGTAIISGTFADHAHAFANPTGSGVAVVTGTFADHAHAFANPTGSGTSVITGTFANHSHAAGGASGAGGAHTHVFAGTAIPTPEAMNVNDALPAALKAVYVTRVVGMLGRLEADTGGGPGVQTLAGGDSVYVYNNGGVASGFALTMDDNQAAGSELECNESLTGEAIYVATTQGKLLKVTHDAAPAGPALFHAPLGGVQDRLQGDFTNTVGQPVGPTYATATDATYEQLQGLAVSAGINASESTHTHTIPATASDGTGAITAADAGHTHTVPNSDTDGTGAITAADAGHTHAVPNSDTDGTGAITAADAGHVHTLA